MTASVGVGHTSAAEAVGASLRESAVDVCVVDSYRYASSLFSKVVSDGYIGIVKTVPQVYRFMYDRAERATSAGTFRTWVSRRTARNLRSLIEELDPSCVVCTHAFPCGVMSHYKAEIDPDLPVVGVVTDFVVHPYWIYRNVDAYAVATPEMRESLVARGVAPERIGVTGIPIDPRFSRDEPKAEARRVLGVERNARMVLVMAGGLGIGPIETMLEALSRLDSHGLQAVVLVGRNPRREAHLKEWVRRLPYPAVVHGFERNVFEYMRAADVLLTKPGGLTTSEALAARLPMVLVKPLPGQEERNTQYLCERGAALRANDEAGIAGAVERILSGDAGRVLERIDALRRPEAAADVAAMALRRSGRGTPAPVLV